MTQPLLVLDTVGVQLATPRGPLRAVDDVSLTLEPGRTLGIVGESGSGKTMLSRAILRLLPANATLSGSVRFDGEELTRLDSEALRRLRGRSIAVIFQDPMTSLNPVLTIGTQIVETLQAHLELGAAAARARAIELLAAVGLPAPESWCGYWCSRSSGAGRPTAASSSIARARAAAASSSR